MRSPSARSRAPLGASVGLVLGLALTSGLTGCSSDAPAEEAAATTSVEPTASAEPSPTEEPTDVDDKGEDGIDPDSEQFVRELSTFFELDPADAECFVATYQRAGLTVADLNAFAQGRTPEGVSPSAYASASTEAVECLDPKEREKFLEKSLELSPQSAIRNGFITSFVASAPAGVTRQQAGCVYDDLVDGGIDITDLADAQASAEVQSALQAAFKACDIG